jgi:hypothetical protein
MLSRTWPCTGLEESVGDAVNAFDKAPGNRSRVNERRQPTRLGWGPDHETHQAHSGVDHPEAKKRRVADRPGQVRCRRLWRAEGLQWTTPRKRKRARKADSSLRRQRAQHPH